MLTECSHCNTRFRVTAAQLKAAGGKVRCSRCHTVFDAFESLQEEITGGRVPLPRAPQPAPIPAVDAAGAPEFDDIALSAAQGEMPEVDVAVEAGTPLFGETPELAIAPEKAAPAMDDLFAGLPDANELQDKTRGQAPVPADVPSANFDELPALPEKSQAPEFELPKKPGRRSTRTTTQPKGKKPDKAAIKQSPADIILAPLAARHAPPPAPHRPAHTLLWSLGLVFMLLWLAVQLVNAERRDLAQNPVIGPSLKALYAALGHPLAPAQDPSQWGVDSFNVTSDPEAPGALSITGTLENQAGDVQPWPLLRVVLTDRYGDTLRGRDFKPADYLPASQANVLLAGGQAARFRIDVADPGADAVGFAIQPCFDAGSTRVCATTEHD